ncbi:hypothetical protein CR513_10147, partial [Mucuna pruriens]
MSMSDAILTTLEEEPQARKEDKENMDTKALQGPMIGGRMRILQEEVLKEIGFLKSLENLTTLAFYHSTLPYELLNIQDDQEPKDSQALQGPITKGRIRTLQEEVLQKLGMLKSLEDSSPSPSPSLAIYSLLHQGGLGQPRLQGDPMESSSGIKSTLRFAFHLVSWKGKSHCMLLEVYGGFSGVEVREKRVRQKMASSSFNMKDLSPKSKLMMKYLKKLEEKIENLGGGNIDSQCPTKRIMILKNNGNINNKSSQEEASTSGSEGYSSEEVSYEEDLIIYSGLKFEEGEPEEDLVSTQEVFKMIKRQRIVKHSKTQLLKEI